MVRAMAIYLSDQIKELLTPKEVVERYGFEINRSGFIKCPFHTGDDHGSLKIYPNNWHCFGCGKGGSVIDFAQELFGLDNKAAMDRLCIDFGLNITRTHETSCERSERVRAAEKAARELATFQAEYDRRCIEYRRLWIAKKYKAPKRSCESPCDEYVEACTKIDALNHWFDCNPYRR